jgi:hypothetical protein
VLPAREDVGSATCGINGHQFDKVEMPSALRRCRAWNAMLSHAEQMR